MNKYILILLLTVNCIAKQFTGEVIGMHNGLKDIEVKNKTETKLITLKHRSSSLMGKLVTVEYIEECNKNINGIIIRSDLIYTNEMRETIELTLNKQSVKARKARIIKDWEAKRKRQRERKRLLSQAETINNFTDFYYKNTVRAKRQLYNKKIVLKGYIKMITNDVDGEPFFVVGGEYDTIYDSIFVKVYPYKDQINKLLTLDVGDYVVFSTYYIGDENVITFYEGVFLFP